MWQGPSGRSKNMAPLPDVSVLCADLQRVQGKLQPDGHAVSVMCTSHAAARMPAEAMLSNSFLHTSANTSVKVPPLSMLKRRSLAILLRFALWWASLCV